MIMYLRVFLENGDVIQINFEFIINVDRITMYWMSNFNQI